MLILEKFTIYNFSSLSTFVGKSDRQETENVGILVYIYSYIWQPADCNYTSIQTRPVDTRDLETLLNSFVNSHALTVLTIHVRQAMHA